MASNTLRRDEVLEKLFTHYVTLKMYHFQTKSYAVHKAVDEYISTFLGHFDSFAETLQGASAKNFETTHLKLEITTIGNGASAGIYLLDYISFLKGLSKTDVIKANSDLVNIRDDMLASAHQLKYLLRFTA